MRFYLTVALVIVLMSGCSRIAATSWRNMDKANDPSMRDDVTASEMGEVIQNDVIYY